MIPPPPPSLAWDIVSPKDPIYALLAQAARGGTLPGYTAADFLRGDRLFTRRELEALLDRAVSPKTAFSVLADSKRGLLPRGVATATVGRDGFGIAQATRFGIDTAYFQQTGRLADLTVGRRPVRWGPGWTGGLLLSDSAPSFDGIQVDKTFSAGRLGHLHFAQLYGQFFETDDPTVPASARGTRRHLAARRLSTATERPWQFSVGEAIKAIPLPDPAFAAVLPWYVYEHDWTHNGTGRWLGLPRSQSFPDSFWLNYMGDISVRYDDKAHNNAFYGELLLDDIKAPKGLGQGNNTPQRTGLLVGTTITRPSVTVRSELATIDKRTYLSDAVPNYWFRGSSPLGSPVGPNGLVWFTRAELPTRNGLALAFEAELRRRRVREPGTAGSNRHRLTAIGTYTLDPQHFVLARVGTEGVTATVGWTP